jgi:hypothetical protein
MKRQNEKAMSVLILALALLVVGAAALGAQEGPPPPPDGLSFSGSVITGLRYRSYAADGNENVTGDHDMDPATPDQLYNRATYGYNVFDIDAGDDYLVEGDTAALTATYNKGNYGGTFSLAFNANNSRFGLWTPLALNINEVSLWGQFLDNKIKVKAGQFGDFDYTSPINVWSMAGGPASNAIHLTVYPIQGLQFDVRTKNLQNSNPDHNPFVSNNWYTGMDYVRNIDVGVRYVNPNFTVALVLDDDYTKPGSVAGPPPPFARGDYQVDVYGIFAFTGVPKLSVGLETRFYDLTSERKKLGTTDALGITNVTALNASYQITDALSARLWVDVGADIAGLTGGALALLQDDGFTVAADLEMAYKLNDSITFSLRPMFGIPDTDKEGFIVSVKPRVSWAIAPFPFAATINFWYMLRYYDEHTTAYTNNDKEALNHTVACTFGWTF